MKAHLRHKGPCRISTGTEREGLWRVLRLAQYSKVHCHHWSSLGCRSSLQLLRKFIPCQTLDVMTMHKRQKGSCSINTGRDEKGFGGCGGQSKKAGRVSTKGQREKGSCDYPLNKTALLVVEESQVHNTESLCLIKNWTQLLKVCQGKVSLRRCLLHPMSK